MGLFVFLGEKFMELRYICATHIEPSEWEKAKAYAEKEFRLSKFIV